ncbi:type II restriction endonuclease [Candidatus Margulisiibacteriota bacterium]
MKKGHLSQYFQEIAYKRLSAVEANPKVSNQHEFNGVSSLRSIFGDQKVEKMPTMFLYFEEEDPVIDAGFLTWYDSREGNDERSAEYRLYYTGTDVSEESSEGDLLVIGKQSSGDIAVIIAKQGSTVENQILWLFGIPEEIDSKIHSIKVEDSKDKPLNYISNKILENIGVEIEDVTISMLDKLVEKYGDKFPTTKVFSSYSRSTVPEMTIKDSPDDVIIAWMDQEEKLFRTFERHIVAKRLKEGFGEDVDSFVSFSLSVHNRRKSRAGYALQHHLEELFKIQKVNFDRDAVTENKATPDFIFPSIKDYHNRKFPIKKLTMLGAKTTCKDRWRQVLSEAARIKNKHLITLEPGISENQTNEMRANKLQLVIPGNIHETYKADQQKWLMSVEGFVDLVRKKQ